jgi:hypothetical protein
MPASLLARFFVTGSLKESERRIEQKRPTDKHKRWLSFPMTIARELPSPIMGRILFRIYLLSVLNRECRIGISAAPPPCSFSCG